jgi:hypothetical protein
LIAYVGRKVSVLIGMTFLPVYGAAVVYIVLDSFFHLIPYSPAGLWAVGIFVFGSLLQPFFLIYALFARATDKAVELNIIDERTALVSCLDLKTGKQQRFRIKGIAIFDCNYFRLRTTGLQILFMRLDSDEDAKRILALSKRDSKWRPF